MSRAGTSFVLAAGATLLALSLTASDSAATTITVVNNDGAGEGFNDPTPVAPVGGNPGTTLGAQRLNAFQFAAGIWASFINTSEEIRVAASFDSLQCDAMSAVLGVGKPHTAARDFSGAPVANTWYPIALANSLAGMDLDPGNDDIDVQFNSDFGNGCAFPGSFYLGLDGNPPGLNDSDLVTVLLHEMCHGLGFGTLVNLSSGAKAPPSGLDDTYMLNLEDHSTGTLWPAMTDGERVTSSVDTGDLHWVGTAVVAAGVMLSKGRHPSGHVEMFAPDPLEPGSSVSHWSDDLAPDEIMEPVYTGPNHNPRLAVFLLGDLGWSVNPPPVVPAPNKCASAKIKAAGKKTACLLALVGKSAASGDPIDSAKRQKCLTKFSAAFTKAELKGGCITTGDVDDIEDKIDVAADGPTSTLAAPLFPPTPNACQAAKIKATGKKAKCVLGLRAKVAGKGGSVDPLKLAKCTGKFGSAFTKAETKGGCETTGDVDDEETLVDAFVDDVDAELKGGSPSGAFLDP
jgi:hypothetical protein